MNGPRNRIFAAANEHVNPQITSEVTMQTLKKKWLKYLVILNITLHHVPIDWRLCRGAFPNCAGVGASLNSLSS